MKTNKYKSIKNEALARFDIPRVKDKKNFSKIDNMIKNINGNISYKKFLTQINIKDDNGLHLKN